MNQANSSKQGEKSLKAKEKSNALRQIRRSDLQEELASLYLRLNGYFVSGFIVHGREGRPRSNRAQIDILAVRFPYNSEEEREIGPSEYLQTSSTNTDILICEVKGGRQALQFNPSLRNDPQSVCTVLKWIGAFQKEELEDLVHRVSDILSPQEFSSPDSFRHIPGPRGICIRAILFAPDRGAPARNQIRYIHGQEIINYIWKCLRPEQPRPMSATRYDFGAWSVYKDLIRYFKGLDRKPEDLQSIYDHLEL